MDVDEQNIEDLFDDDNPSEIDEVESRGSPTRELSAANLELGDNDQAGNLNSTTHDDVGASTNKIIKPKRNIAKQPLLNADRILGKRGIRVLEKLFEDFEPRDGKEFEDLDIVIDRMKHWAHRLYPKLPFDDVTKQIAHVGKKMQVQANVKKMRLGMDLDPHFEKDVADEDDEENQDPTKKQQQNQEDDVERYDNEPQEDVFEQLIREANERMAQDEAVNKKEKTNTFEDADSQIPSDHSNKDQIPKPPMTEEQKQRMLKNRQLAEEKRKQKQAEKSQLLQNGDSILNDADEINST